MLTFSLDFLQLLNVSRDTTLPFPVGSSHYKLYNAINTFGFFSSSLLVGINDMWTHLVDSICAHGPVCTTLSVCTHRPFHACVGWTLTGTRGCEYHFAFSSLLSPMRHLFSQQFRFFCGSSNRVKVAASVSLKQWINGRNTASSHTTVVFWLVTNCCCTCHLIFTLSHLLCSQTRLSSFVDSTTNVQAHATHALVPYFPTEFLLKSLKRWRPFFVEKRIKWIHFFAFLHANTAQWYGKGTTTTFKMHKAQTMGN